MNGEENPMVGGIASPNTLQLEAVQRPSIHIVEQPKSHGLRFRYECESRTAGSILGERSTDQRKSFPAIELRHARGPAAIVVSCVSKDSPHRPHPHKLVGPHCKQGVCTVKMESGDVRHEFSNLGIQCVKRNKIAEALQQRKKIQVDPFQRGYQENDVDMSCVRLCFQAFLKNDQGRFHNILEPVVSNEIYDKKIVNDLRIDRYSLRNGSAEGGNEVFLLTEKVQKENIEVRFFEESEGQVIWEAKGVFGQQDVHKQMAIVFKTPPYKDKFIREAREVRFQLRRPSDGLVSEPRTFVYEPPLHDSEGISAKRKKPLSSNFKSFYHDQPPGAQAIVEEAERRKLTARRRLSTQHEGVGQQQSTFIGQSLAQPDTQGLGDGFLQLADDSSITQVLNELAMQAPPAQPYNPVAMSDYYNVLHQSLTLEDPVMNVTNGQQLFDSDLLSQATASSGLP